MKAPDAFRTISEVAEDLDLPQHVLRFWETRFHQIKPMKRGGGRRYYRPEDVDLLRGIRLLLYSDGYTIRGVQRLLKERGVGFVAAVGQSGSVRTAAAAERKGGAPPDLPAPIAEDTDAAAAAEAGYEDDAEDSFPEAAPQQPLPPPVTGPGLSREARRRIEAALGELAEARRLLDQVR